MWLITMMVTIMLDSSNIDLKAILEQMLENVLLSNVKKALFASMADALNKTPNVPLLNAKEAIVAKMVNAFQEDIDPEKQFANL